MARGPTNTLIITELPSNLLHDPQILIEFLSQKHYLIQLIVLLKFSRILIISESPQISQSIYNLLSKQFTPKCKISYSLQNNQFSLDHNDISQLTHCSKDYLELPHDLQTKRFLISPPLSPHSEWNDWNKLEEGPNEKSIYSPNELSHLLWEKLGGFESDIVQKYNKQEETENEQVNISKQPELLFQDIKNGVPAIILNPTTKTIPENPMPKTCLPP